MKKFEEMNNEEMNEVSELFASWLGAYTHEVIVKVLERREEIVNNEFTMSLLRELHDREAKERHDFTVRIGSLLLDLDGFAQYDSHSHPLTHAKSYRDVLYDMYIR